jgi:exodeoxyribonuclease-3
VRLTTWNCWRHSVSESVQALAPLNPNIVVLQECAEPKEPISPGEWRHTAKQLGVATVGVGISPVFPNANEELPSSALLAVVEGPTPFALVNVWAQLPRYEEDVLNCIRAARRVLPSDVPLIVAGDFNSSPAVRSQERRSLELIRVLREEFGLVSAYHDRFGVEPGRELHPTYYHQRKENAPFHIDYCFVPESWTEKIASVEVGSYSEWTGSDHRPVTVRLTG